MVQMKHTLTEKTHLLDALIKLAPDSTKTTLRSWLKNGRVLVDGEVEKIGSKELEPGQEISVGARPRMLEGDIRIIYEDQHLIAIDKPEGLLSVATDFQKEKTVHCFLKNHYNKMVYPVHRLDQDTSGVMIFALNEKTRNHFKKIFEKHEIERCYVAIIEGHLKEKSGTWDSYQFEDANYVVHTTKDPSKGVHAITHFKVIDESKKYSWLELRLETGKKNQIRVHCKDAGHPIAGDKKYGAVSNPIRRLCLHAALLVLEHPESKKKMRFESPVPPAFRKIVNVKCTAI